MAKSWAEGVGYSPSSSIAAAAAAGALTAAAVTAAAAAAAVAPQEGFRQAGLSLWRPHPGSDASHAIPNMPQGLRYRAPRDPARKDEIDTRGDERWRPGRGCRGFPYHHRGAG